MGLGRGSGFSDGKIVIGTQVDMYGMNTGLAKIQKTFKSLKYMSAGILGGFGLVKFGKAAIDAASDLAEVQNIVDVAFGDMEYKIEAFSKTCIDSFGVSEVAAKQTAGSFMAMGKASGIAEEQASDMAVKLTALSGDMASFYNISQDYARVALSAVYTGETETLKRYGIILTEANLQQYAATKGITKKVKAMSAADKATLRYNYILEQTTMVEGDFIRTQDNWANQSRILKQRWNEFLITVGSGLITVLSPALKLLNRFLQYLTAWANQIGHILAKLFGINWQDLSSEMSQLSDNTSGLGESEEDLADGIGAATKAAKRSLAPFDDLNVLTENIASNAGGVADLGLGIGDIGFDFSNMKAEDIGFEFPDISSWYEFGEYLSNTLKSILDKIPWDDIYEGARNFGTNFASFLNGLIQPETFRTVGTTIAGALNTAIEFALGFGQEFDFVNFGLALSEAINGFFEEWNAKDAAECINTWVQGFWDAIKAFFKGDESGDGGIDWPLVRNKLAEFFSNIDIETVGLIIGAITIKKVGSWLISGAATKALGNAVGTWLTSESTKTAASGSFKAAGEWIATNLGGVVGMSLSDASSITVTELFGAGTFAEIAGYVVGGIVTAIAGLITGTNLGGLFSYLFTGDEGAYEDYMGLTGWITMIGDLAIAIKDFVSDPDVGYFPGLIKGIADIFSGDWMSGTEQLWKTQFKWQWFLPDDLKSLENQERVIDEFQKKYSSFEEWITAPGRFFYDPDTGVWAKVANWFTGLGETVSGAFTTAIDGIKSTWNDLSNWFVDAGDTIKNDFNNIIGGIKNVWVTVSTWFVDNVITPIREAFEPFCEWWSSVFESVWIIVKAVWIIAANWFNTNVIQPIQNFFQAAITFILTAFTNLWNGIKTVWSVVSNWFLTTVIQPIQNFFNTAIQFIANAFTTLWTTIQTVWSVASNWFLTNVIQPIQTFFQNLVTTIKTFFQNLWNNIKTIWSTVSAWFNNYVIIPIRNFFQNLITNIKNFFITLWNDIKQIWQNVANWFNTYVIQPIIGFFKNMWNNIIAGMKGAINNAIGAVEGFVNTIIDGLNIFTSGLSLLSSAASKITGDDYSGIGTIDHIQLPRLAKGAVIPPNKEFMAILGDQKHGTNIEAPLDTIVDAFKVATSDSDNNMIVALLQQQIQLLQAIADKNFSITDKQVFESVQRSSLDYVKRHGTVPFGA